MENSQHIKSVSTDPRSKNRIRYKSSRQRAKSASADVYRSYKRQFGVTSAASREERVHHPSREESGRERKRQKRQPSGSDDRVAILRNDMHVDEDTMDDSDVDFESTFASELDLALDRNASEIFGRFYREVWHLARSLPEVLHNGEEIVCILVSYLLSPESDPSTRSKIVTKIPGIHEDREIFVTNHATTDILHLLAVLARDLRHEIHPFVHTLIVPRIVYDLLNPPLPPPDSGQQPLPLNVTVVEAAFRTLSYVFRYDAQPLLTEVDKEGQEPCLERLRQYYGATLGHRRDYVRRLAAETFAPMIRKLGSDSSRRRHLRRVLRALATSASTISVNERPLSECLTRSQRDAVDGIALLYFETARGANGRLHSKGQLIVRCLFECVTATDDSAKTFDENRIEMMRLVVSTAIDKLCGYLTQDAFCSVWDELQRISRRVATMLPALSTVEDNKNFDQSQTFCPLVSALSLWEKCTSFNAGRYLTDKSSDSQKVIKSIVDLLERLLSPAVFNGLPQAIQMLVLRVLCSSWRVLLDNALFVSRIGDVLPELLRSTPDQKVLFHTAEFLAYELLPHLPPQTGIKCVGTAILSAAAQKASQHQSEALMLILAVASTDVDESGASNDSDDLFFVEGARHCDISDQERNQLIDLCLIDLAAGRLSSAVLAQVAVATRCLPFLACSGGAEESKQCQKRVGKWTHQSLKLLCSSMKTASDGTDATEQELVVASAFLLESYSVLTRQRGSCHGRELTLLRPLAERMLFAHPMSLWTVKSVASYVNATKDRHEQFSESIDAVFDALIPNLGMPNHFLRLHTLEILCSFPQRPFITDHADIDWTGDLDEEPSSTSGKFTAVEDGHSSTLTVGLCDILETLLNLESCPISLDNERHLVSCITRVEMLTRKGRLPIVYAEAAANHMLGVLNIKFAPIWAPAVRTLTVLASTNEACAWPPLLYALGKSMVPGIDHAAGDDVSTADSQLRHCTEHFSKCILWDESEGSNPLLFSNDIAKANEEGKVSRHLSTDRLTICDLVWSVLEKSPELAAKKSRGVVPIFLEFLLSQYYCFNDHEADARELNLEAEVENRTNWPSAVLRRNEIQQRLLCFLKMFAAINGPRQLYKHELLLSIFTAFLCHQETRVAQTALSCILRYKLPFVLPYADHLQAMLKKGELREALLRFDISKSTGIIMADHRASFIPMMTRILFGRLSSRVSTGKSSKDTPATRRASILSFLSALSEDESELYPLFYLMVRSYVPTGYALKPVEDQTEEDRMRMDELLNSLELNDVAKIPVQRHEGFLNLLSAVVNQLGKGVKFLPCFLSIVVTLCKYSEIKVVNEAPKSDMVGSSENSPANRLGTVRTLCFRRLADCFDQYADSLDFMPYCERLWASVTLSIDCLPSAAATADRAPALLVMLETLSRHASLIRLLLRNEAAVEGVIMCVAPSTQQPVMESTLNFMDNLMTNGGTITDEGAVENSSMDGPGLLLIRKHLPLILRYFAERLGAFSNTGWKRSSTKSKELSILCRLSRLLLGSGRDIGSLDELETLSGLLIGYLQSFSKGNEFDQLQVIEILTLLIPRIDGDTALSFLPTVSKLLGPVKSSAGIESVKIRKSLALLVQSISGCAGVPTELKEIAAVSLQLCASHSKRVDELDYDLVSLALTGLSDTESTTSWTALCGKLGDNIEIGDPTFLIPLVNICSHLLHSNDGVVSRGSFKALKTLLVLAGRQLTKYEDFAGFIEKGVVPIIRNGLSSRSQPARRHFILLLAEVARNFKNHPSPNLYGDLAYLIRDDEPELDFFLNITHVQIHRRCRALQRLREMLVREGPDKFRLQSLSNVLLPIALHPIYESKTKLEEPFALEAISAVGAISKSLSWSKYHSTLWTSLIQLQRNSEQERYLIDMICSMLDSFHFQLEKSSPDDEDNLKNDEIELSGNAVWRALENRIIPKVENLLFKEKIGRDNEKIKVLRPQVVLALLKLFRKFPMEVFESKLPRLLAIMCGALKSKDSDSRDVARVTLAKMTTSMSKKYLNQVIHHLSTSLTEGYQLHVRMATLHTILLHTAEHSSVILPASSVSEENRSFDQCIPMMMNLIQDDLFGTARERREVEGAKKRFVKEASGSKSDDAIELICRQLEFKPSLATKQESGPSSIHCVVMPLLGKLESQDTTATTIGRIRECLSRVIVGLSKNQSVTASEMFPFIYASVSPFIAAQKQTHEDDDSSSDYDEQDRKIFVSSDKPRMSSQKTEGQSTSKHGNVVQWRPSALRVSTSNLAARNTKDRDHRELHRVQDGYNAPKLTGNRRLQPTSNTLETLNNPASICAVLFGLGLLHSNLKKTKIANETGAKKMVDPFIPLLTTCLCASRDDDVILLSIRCLVLLLRMPLSSVEGCSTDIGRKALDILTLSGSLINLNQELTQSCFKVLTLLISKVDIQERTDLRSISVTENENALSSGKSLPLDPTQMQALISLLKGAMVDTDHHNPTFGLIKAITSRRYISAEFYDLMETCLDLSVRSQKVAVRQLSGSIFMQYLLEYPMGKQRLEDHLNQIVSNTKYEYEEGRLSGLGLVTTVVEKLPSPLLEEHAQLFFLPLVLQLANDESKECREAVAKCLARLLARVSLDMVQSFYEYAVRWSKGDCTLQRTSIQLLGIFVDSRPEFLARSDTARILLDRLCDFLDLSGGENDWEIPYFALVCLEKMRSRLPEFGWNDRCAGLVVDSMVDDHPWVRRAACRLVVAEISDIKPESLPESATSRLVTSHGLLYKVATNICVLLDLGEDEQDEELSHGVIKILSWIFQASRTAPSLFADNDSTEKGQEDPAFWLIERLSHIAKQKGSKRRSGIFKAFAAFASLSSADRILPLLEFMIEPLHRSITEAENVSSVSKASFHRGRSMTDEETVEATLARDTLQILEDCCSEHTDEFLRAYANVKTKARDKKEQRKQHAATEAIRDPRAAAVRKMKKQEREKRRRKRRVGDQRLQRGGGDAKRRHLS